MGNKTSSINETESDDCNKFSHFPAKDVQGWSIMFRSQYQSGRMNIHDLETLFRRFFPFGSNRKFVKRMFNTINISQLGYIDFHELLIAFSILTKGSNFEKLRWIFRFYDEDNDGVISKSEMVSIVQSVIDMVSNTLNLHVDVEKSVNEIFETCENKSGFLTFDDFKELALRKEDEFKLLTLFIN